MFAQDDEPDFDHITDETCGINGKDMECKGILEEVCSWPIYHQDCREALKTGKYRGEHMGMTDVEPIATRAGSQLSQEIIGEEVCDVIEAVNNRGLEVVSFLLPRLREKVFPEEEKKMLNQVRKILDLKFIIEKVKTHSSDSVANIHYQGFIETAKMFEPLILDRIVEGEL